MSPLPMACGALAYHWCEGALLSRSQAAYALQHLWRLVAGDAGWEGPPVVAIPAISPEAWSAELALPPGRLPWLPLAGILGGAPDPGLDGGFLPGLCQVPGGHHAEMMPIDPVAACFLLLTRWEDRRSPRPDIYGRQEEDASLGARQGFLQRPVIDEWALVLRSLVMVRRPAWSAQPPPSSWWLTHDIDQIRYFTGPIRLLRCAAGELLKRHAPLAACRRAWTGISSLLAPERDPFFRGIRELGDFDESLGSPGGFFIMTADHDGVDDGYDPADPAIAAVLRDLVARGHEIGWHVSYAASCRPETYDLEFQRYVALFGRPPESIRHHMLAWHGPASWRQAERHGILRDSSCGFRGSAGGFRCGTCHPYPAYDLDADEQLRIIEQPLILMDKSITSKLAAGEAAAKAHLDQLWQRTRAVSGCLTVLLHNSFGFYNRPAELAMLTWLRQLALERPGRRP